MAWMFINFGDYGFLYFFFRNLFSKQHSDKRVEKHRSIYNNNKFN
jgi:hypothetical protein